MNTFRLGMAAIVVGLLCIAAAILWPEMPDPRGRWTNEKSADFMATSRELQALSHDLVGAMDHATGDPSHVHSPTETVADPRLTALQLERSREHSAALRAELEAARTVPPGWNLLLGLIGMILAVVGFIVMVATRGNR